MTDIEQTNSLEQNINLDASQEIQSEDIPEAAAETVVEAAETVVETAAETVVEAAETVVETAAETLTPKDKVEQNLKQKTKELVNEEEVINELLTNPTLLGKRKWENRDKIARVLHLNINEPVYDHLNEKILDMYNNGMKDEYLETTDKYMMECVGDYLSNMENIHKKYIEYYIRSIRASKLPEDENYIRANYRNLQHMVVCEYNNYELALKISALTCDLYDVPSQWINNRIQHTPQNKKLMFISVINNFLMGKDDNLSDFSEYNKFDLKNKFNGSGLTKEDIDEFMALWDEVGMPRQYIKEPFASKILAGKLKLNLDKLQDCPVCMETNVNCVPINWVCGHYICVNCHNDIVEQKKCPMCRLDFNL